MDGSGAKQHKDKQAEQTGHTVESTNAPGLVGPRAGILGLQRAAGNQAVSSLIQQVLPPPVQEVIRSPGQPLDAKVRSEMEAKFDHDFEGVRIHTDSRAAESARSVHAKAYTFGQDIVFASNKYSPEDKVGKKLLSHELAHVIQQERGGAVPPLDPGAAHETGADGTANAIVNGTAPVQVSGATGIGLARAVEDWFDSTPNFQTWTFTQLVDEIDEIKQWLSHQIATSDKTIALELALTSLEAEVKSRQKVVDRRPKSKPKSAKSRGKQKQATSPDESALPLPRVLRERTSVEYKDPEELRQEIDLIMAWLRRDDLPRDQRQILQVELANLAPSFDQSRVQRATERRSAKIQQALAPDAKDANDQLIKAAKLVDSIAPIPGRPGFFSLMHGNELIELQTSEVEGIRKSVQQHFLQGANKIRGRTQAAKSKYDYQKEVNKDHPVVSFFVHTFGNIDDPGAELQQDIKWAMEFSQSVQSHAEKGNFEKAARFLVLAGESGAKASLLANAYTEEIISTAEATVAVLELTRDISFGIAIGIGAAVAAPIVFGGAAAVAGGIGLTGTVATGAAALGTGGVVIGGGAVGGGVLRGSSNLAGQALTGDVSFSEVKRETIAGAKRGAVDAATGVVTAGTGSALGQGVTTTARVAKGAVSGFAGGTAGGGLEATLEGKSAGEVVETALKRGVSGGVGGGLGGAARKALSSRSAVTRVLTGSATGGAGGAAGAFVTGGSAEEIKQAGITGAITGGITAAPSPKPKPSGSQKQQPTAKSDAPDAEIDSLIAQLESGGETGGFRAEGPGVRIPQRRSSTHSPTTAQPPARVLEVGAGRKRTNLGIPTQRKLVGTTRTDIRGQKPAAVATRGLHQLDANLPIPGEFIGQFDTVVINNPRGYTPNILELGKALRPGGRIIIQGRGAAHPKQRGINPDFQRLLEADPPPGYRKIVDLPPPAAGLPQHAPPQTMLGGPFFRTSGEGTVLPNARIIYERIEVD